MKKNLPDAEMCRRLLDYNKDSGMLTWKPRTAEMFEDYVTQKGRHMGAATTAKWWNSMYAGKPALNHITHLGYRRGKLLDTMQNAHRVAFCIVEGYWPKMVDHINGDRADNSWSNLREVNAAGNCKNKALSSRNTSGRSGVIFIKNCGKWRAHISLGQFSTFEEACEARQKAEEALGYHPNHGKR